jgi:hypothetical protein
MKVLGNITSYMIFSQYIPTPLLELPVNKCKIVRSMDKFLPQWSHFSIFPHFTLKGERVRGGWFESVWVCVMRYPYGASIRPVFVDSLPTVTHIPIIP